MHKRKIILCINNDKMHKYSKSVKKEDKVLVLFVHLY